MSTYRYGHSRDFERAQAVGEMRADDERQREADDDWFARGAPLTCTTPNCVICTDLRREAA